MAVLERTAASLGDCRLIIIDPVTSYLGNCDDHRNGAVRSVLMPLKEMAERLGVAVVLVTHHNKGPAAGNNGKHRVMGSITFVGVCRANFLFLPDPDDPTGARQWLLDNGGNLAPRQPALVYEVRDNGQGQYCKWLPDTIDISADAALAKAARAASSARTEKGGETRADRLVRR